MAADSKNTPAKHSILQKVSRRKLVLAVLVLLGEVVICIAQIVLGVWVHITIENISAGAFWAPVLLLIGALVSLEGILYPFGRQKMLAMGVMMQVLGIVMALIGAFLESVVASLISHVDFSQCSYSSTGFANCTAELSCEAVQLSFPKSCYCCYLTKERFSPCYFRAVSLFEAPSMYAGVDSCSQVSGEFLSLLWTSVCFCILCCFFGLIAAFATYSYRRAVKPPSISTSTTVTSPMLPRRSSNEGFMKSTTSSSTPSGGSPGLDVPVPAPRNSLARSSSNTLVGTTSVTAETEKKSSTLPKRKKRRAPDIPTAENSGDADSRPSSSSATVVIVRPKSALYRSSTENRLSGYEQRMSGPKSAVGRQAIRVSRSSDNILREARNERPRSATARRSKSGDSSHKRPELQGGLGLPPPGASRTRASSGSATTNASKNPSSSGMVPVSASRTRTSSGTPTASPSKTVKTSKPSTENSSVAASTRAATESPKRTQISSDLQSENLSVPKRSSRTPTASPSRTVPNVSVNDEEIESASHDVVTSSTISSMRDSPSTSTDNSVTPKSENTTPVKKWRSNKKCPAPLTPPELEKKEKEQLQQLQEQQQQVLAAEQQAAAATNFLPSCDPLPQSPPPPFVPHRPPSPPPFTPSASIHYPHNPSHHPHHQQPVTNIHLTLHTTPMGTNVQMPMAGQSGFLFQNQPTAPYL